MKKILICCCLLFQAFADDISEKEAQYGMIVDQTQVIAEEIKLKLDKDALNENEIYTLLSSLVSFDTRIWSAALAFTPSLIDDLEKAKWSGFEKPWHYYNLSDGKKVYAPYVWRSNNNLLHADNIANPESKFGYDYTNGEWEWWSKPIESGSAAWQRPVYSNLTGDRMITYSYPINRDAVLIFNVYYGV